MENTTFGPNFQNKTLSRRGLFSPWDEEAVTLILVENSSCFRRYSVRLYAAASKEKKKKKKRSTSKSMCDDEPAAHCGFDPPDLTAEAYRTVPPLCDVSWPIKLSHTHAPPAPAHNNTEQICFSMHKPWRCQPAERHIEYYAHNVWKPTEANIVK